MQRITTSGPYSKMEPLFCSSEWDRYLKTPGYTNRSQWGNFIRESYWYGIPMKACLGPKSQPSLFWVDPFASCLMQVWVPQLSASSMKPWLACLLFNLKLFKHSFISTEKSRSRLLFNLEPILRYNYKGISLVKSTFHSWYTSFRCIGFPQFHFLCHKSVSI